MINEQQKEALREAMKIVARTTKGLQHTIDQDLTPLFPIEQQMITYGAINLFLVSSMHAAAIIAEILPQGGNNHERTTH